MAAIIRSMRRGRGSRLASRVRATRVPYRAAAAPSNGSGAKSTIAAPNVLGSSGSGGGAFRHREPLMQLGHRDCGDLGNRGECFWFE